MQGGTLAAKIKILAARISFFAERISFFAERIVRIAVAGVLLAVRTALEGERMWTISDDGEVVKIASWNEENPPTLAVKGASGDVIRI